MSNESLKVSYRWIWLPISFGLALCIIVLSLYFIEFGKFGLSKDPTEWASFGSLLAGIFTFLSATGTIGTLIFMIRQHQQLTLSQAEIARKQMEILEFEKYEKHKSTLYESFEFIENYYDGRYFFPSKARAYHRLFPKNSPSMTKYESSKESTVCKIIERYNETILSARAGDISIKQLELLARIINFIKVSPIRKGKKYISGDVHTDRNPPRFNVFNIKDCFFICYNYFVEISRILDLKVELNEPSLTEINFVELSMSAYEKIKNNQETNLKIALHGKIKTLLWLIDKIQENDLTSKSTAFENLLTTKRLLFSNGYSNCEIDLENNLSERIVERLKNAKRALIKLDSYKNTFNSEEQKIIEKL